MAVLKLRHRPAFRDGYLKPAIEAGLVEMAVPSKPCSKNQKYRRTASR